MRRCLHSSSSSSTSWFLRKISPNLTRFHSCSSTPDSVNPINPHYSNICIPHTLFTNQDDQFTSNKPVIADLKQNFSKTKTDNPILTQTHVVESLLRLRKEPESALEYYNWAQKQPGYVLGNVEPLCVLIHILVRFPAYHDEVTKLLDSIVSRDSTSDGLLLYEHIVKCSERFDFELDPWIFNALLTAYERAGRSSDAISLMLGTKSDNNPISTQSRVVESLLRLRKEPDSALEYYNWDQKQPDYPQGDVQPLCVLLHILVRFSAYHGVVRKLLDGIVSNDSSPVGLLLYEHILKCSERFDFELDPWIFNALLTAYARAGRCSDAINCFTLMLSHDIVPTAVAINAVLRLLIRENMILEGKKLYDKVVSKGINYDCETVHIMMRVSLKEGKIENAEKYFIHAKARGVVLDSVSYCAAIRIACSKLDSEGAYKLLREMNKLGCTPFEESFTSMICTCVKQGNMVLALKIKEEMLNSGHSLNTVVVTSLIKGYIRQGDLSSALDLFDRISDSGLCPDNVTYAVMIEGCCSHGNMDKALELNNLMKLAGIQPNVHIVNSLIRGFFKARLPDEAIKLLNDAIVNGIANAFTYDNVLGWLCKEGMIDEAHSKLSKKGVKLGVDSCKQKHVHGKKGSAVHGLSEVKDTFKHGTARPKSFCEWLGGIIDGEGNIQVNKEGKTSLEITVGLEDLRLLRYVQHMLGGSIKMRAGAKSYRYRLQDRLGIIKLMNYVNGHIRHSPRLLQVHHACKVLDIPVILPVTLDAHSNWFAGFFDANGTVDIAMNNLLPQLSIRVTNRLLQDVESFKVVFGGNVYFDSGKNGCYHWVLQSRKDVMTMLGYIKYSTFRSHKSRRFFLVEKYYNLYDLKAFNPDSIHHKAWLAFLDKWNTPMI